MSDPWRQQPGPPPNALHRPTQEHRRGRWLAIALAVVVGIVLVIGSSIVLFLGWSHHDSAAAGNGSATDGPKVPPPLAAPPTTPIRAPRRPYSTLPKSCSLLTEITIQTIYPGAKGREGATSDDTVGGSRHFSRACRWELKTGNYVRFPSVAARGMSGDKYAEIANTFVYRGEVARDAKPNIVMPRIDGKRTIPNLGSEATLVYGSGGEACRLARVLARSRNVRIDVTYGGCDRKPDQPLPTAPIDQQTAINGALLMARDVLQQINKS